MTRIARLQELMRKDDYAAVLLSLGADLPYFTGYHAMPLERVTMAVVPSEGTTTLVVPRLEAPRVEERDDFEIRAWDETEDPVEIVVSLLPFHEPAKVAIGDQTWARFLLRLIELAPTVHFESATPLTRLLRMRKDADEVAALARAAAAADRVAERLGEIRWEGRSEREVSEEIGRGLRQEGHRQVDFAIVASGPNGASPHHEPGTKVIERGDAVVCDFGGTLDDYCSDITRCVTIGDAPADVAKAWDVLRAAQQAAVDAVRPGVAAQDVDRSARQLIAHAGYGDYFIHRTGHGIGRETHEDPYIVEGNAELLEEGMAFSIEPGIYVPGRFGIRLEDIVVVTSDGGRRLNNAPRELLVVA